MKRFHFSVLVSLASAAALAQSTPAAVDKLCEDNLNQDVQPAFNDASFLTSASVLLTPSNQLQLDTNRTRIDPEHIYFPFDQDVSISYVYESAGASHALGFVYYDDLVARGYLAPDGSLADSNNNGILDLHEDIYGLAPTSGLQSRPYVGTGRRCSGTFDSGGFTYSLPELAVNESCTVPSTGTLRTVNLLDARSSASGNIDVDVVGGNAATSTSHHGYSDRGLYKYVPNLLEPVHPDNGNRGIGHLVFLNAEDDGDTDTYRNMTPATDTSGTNNGVPDYDVSNFTADGLLRSSNPDVGVSAFDRTVDLGTIRGGRELIFFLIVWYEAPHNGSTVYPCLRKDSAGRCTLHLQTSTHVFFSKAAWNLDQDDRGVEPVAARNIGCGYDPGCNHSSPSGSSGACAVSDSSTWSGQNLCGWLDNNTLSRLNSTEYRNLNMPDEAAWVSRSASGSLPHVIVGTPSSDPYRWILGFEDLPGGGDRDFNDVVFTINKINGGTARSALVSGDISPDIAEDFTITKVRFTRDDDNTRRCGSPAVAPCWTETSADACNQTPRPSIDYYVAVDCRVRDASGNWIENREDDAVPGPTWTRVPFPNPDDPENPTTQVELDMLALGFTGSQLCWSVRMTSPDDRCVPTVDNIDVGYQAIRSGLYARSSPSTLGNAIIYGGYSTPGSSWGRGWPSTADSQPAAGIRAYDGTRDFRARGHLIMKSLYDPESPTSTNVVQRWNAGRTLAISLNGGDDPLNRKLYTTDDAGARLEVSAEAADDASGSSLFPDALCDAPAINGRDPWDLNFDGTCRTRTHVSKSVTAANNTASDRLFFREWLYGWEDRHDPAPTGPTGSSVRQRWPIGGINLSTVNLAIPPFLDSAARQLPYGERDHYRRNFMDVLRDRPVTAFVGTTRGLLHAFDSGAFALGDDTACTTTVQEFRGHFKPSGSCGNPTARQYGDGTERFAYLPRGLLERYVNGYASFFGSADLARPTLDASATVANVDFGIPGSPPWTINDDLSTMKSEGAKTVLLSSTGRNSPILFGLDVTDPSQSWYPLPLWEYSLLDEDLSDAFSTAAVLPDNAGSRHAPSVGRMSWGNGSGWMAAFATDYQPSGSRAGAVYLMDLKTGTPKSHGTDAFAGVVTLDAGFGIGGEPALIDVNEDGTYDLIYVASTSGKVYRLNLTQLQTTRGLGNVVGKCVIADAPADLALAGESNSQFQQIHSNLSVKLERGLHGNKVRIFFGTGDNPDDATDGPDAPGSPVSRSDYHWHLMAYEDDSPLESGCTPLEPLWARHLDDNQAVWGGVMITEKDVVATTAVGPSADACNLSEDESGKLYSVEQTPDASGDPVSNDGDGSDLGGHGVNAPIIHDKHLFVMTADGKLRMVGDDNWNNQTGKAGSRSTRILLWKPRNNGSLPE